MMRPVAMLLILMTIVLTNCGESPAGRLLPSSPPDFVHKPDSDLSALGHYSRAIKLETHPDAILGNINEIKLDPRNGDLLVADFRVTKKVYRFNQKGQFLRSYGTIGQGPGEYRGLMGFAPMDDGRLVVLSTYKMILFSMDGAYLDSAQVKIAPHGVQTHGNRIYIHAISGRKRIKHAVHVYDDDFHKVTEFHPYDRRIDQLPFIPRNSLAKGSGGFFVSESYDFRLAAYDWNGRRQQAWRFPADNEQLQPFWQKLGQGPLSPKDKKAFFALLHRPIYTFAVGELVYLHEVKTSQNIERSCLLDPQTSQVTVFDNLTLISEAGRDDYLTLDGLVGSHNDGLIGYLEDPARLARHRSSTPALEGLELNESENPIVLFFDITAAGKGQLSGRSRSENEQ